MGLVSAAAFAFLRHQLSQKGRETCRPPLHVSLSSIPVHTHCIGSGQHWSWVGREWCWAEASVALTLSIEGASLGMWAPCLIVGGGDQPHALRALVSSAPVDCVYYLVLPSGIHHLFLWGLGTLSFICVHPCSIPCQ